MANQSSPFSQFASFTPCDQQYALKHQVALSKAKWVLFISVMVMLSYSVMQRLDPASIWHSANADLLWVPLKSLNQWINGAIESLQLQVLPIRNDMSIWLRSSLPHMSSQAILPALVVGDRQFLSHHHWQAFAATGTSHLMAISGLHVGMVWGGLYGLFSLGVRRNLAIVVAFSFTSLYCLLAGLSLPTQRAWLMLLVVTLAMLSRRYLVVWDGWLLAMGLTLLRDINAPLQVSFWLSFLAVAILFFVGNSQLEPMLLDIHRFEAQQTRRARWSRAVQLWVRYQCALLIGLAPVVGWVFGTFSWVSPFVNALAVPVITFLIMPPLLLITGIQFALVEGAFLQHTFLPHLLQALLQWVSLVTDGYWMLLEQLAENPNITLSFPPLAQDQPSLSSSPPLQPLQSLMQVGHPMKYSEWLFIILLPSMMWLMAIVLPAALPGRTLFIFSSTVLLLTMFGLNW